MTHSPSDIAPATPTALTTTQRHDGWTPARQTAFLRALASSHSVAAAARQAGMSRQSAYALRARLKGEPFDLAWTAALRCRFDALAEAAMERALHGVEVPHFHKGELVHTSRRFDERLTVALLAMRDSFRGPRVPPSHRASAYDPDDFRGLLARIEEGPETWDEQVRLEYEALYAGEEMEDRCPECGSDEACDCAPGEGV
ncbi:hypothetical protein ACI5KX_04515 [Erythrobacter sp. GH1-10]|uniref:hypothetical protein n=1 Tax=Erythrobacter sp. GH1-10 TaxID=3349334 RepID=UPI0038779DC9